ncbi:hypothetical protein [Coralliovum pocilloporae]|uniref:hypothetical protein n=1 Tax=Coralliovum pocilloporae TaxID=3066369 RepID=UPI003307381F
MVQPVENRRPDVTVAKASPQVDSIKPLGQHSQTDACSLWAGIEAHAHHHHPYDHLNKSLRDNLCSCDHYAPPLEVLVSTAFNRDLAAYWTIEGTGAPEIYKAVLDELTVYHTGKLYGFDRKRLDLFKWGEGGDDFIDRAFGQDAYRSLRRYLDRVRVNRVNRLSRVHYDLALLLHHGRSIRNCRLIGPCAQRER